MRIQLLSNIQLYGYQIEAVNNLKNGAILCAGVGLGKSRTALAYYILNVCKGGLRINGVGKTRPLKTPKDLYIITTAKKRDSLEWESECALFNILKNEKSISGVRLVVDSWNNIKKYINVKDAFFIFDEQRVVGYGTWSKSFIKISRSNEWILLTATPADKWTDYIPVFIANRFYRNKREFTERHVIYNRYSKYPKIDRWLDERHLKKLESSILVKMEGANKTTRHLMTITCIYDRDLFRRVYRDRWDIYDDCPINEISKTLYLCRRVCNSDPSRIEQVANIQKEHPRVIIFYNFSYELEILRKYCTDNKIAFAEWNGEKHEPTPTGEKWVYLIQYTAGCEGWNCITTDTIIFYSQSYSYRQTEQARGRIDRSNTPYDDLYYYTLVSKAPIDIAIQQALRNKKNFNERKFLNASGFPKKN